MKLEIGKKYDVLNPNMVEIEPDMEYLGDTFVFNTRIHLFRCIEEPNYIISHSEKTLEQHIKPTKHN